ncbi:MAG TPA: lipocalin-like domain-containing protein [Steroidobacteraceae bacterium]|nr:lipocalin-like domain-containing protein [Steroidobacteraceae bacterium]
MRKALMLPAGCLLAMLAAAGTQYAPVSAGQTLRFPQDLGSHPQFRTEWWYVTGWLTTEHGESLGFQITFFRTKPDIQEDNPSAFAPRQLLVAHCALSDPKRGRLWQDQRIRRAGLKLAEAAEGDTNVWIDTWSLRHADQTYAAKIDADEFSFDLSLAETQAALINGDGGVSRKGPSPQASSYYYSLPHMRVAGLISRNAAKDRVTGEAWFDHEWSSEYLDPEAAGWDWIGINFTDGAALMAFRIRGLKGEQRWAGGTLRGADGATHILEPADVDFRAGRRWVSPRTGIAYPVEWMIRAGARDISLRPLLDDQENDTRVSTGAIYWEGAVKAYEQDSLAGRGYLELTGYGERLKLR